MKNKKAYFTQPLIQNLPADKNSPSLMFIFAKQIINLHILEIITVITPPPPRGEQMFYFFLLMYLFPSFPF
jgi:hypothetical protein